MESFVFFAVGFLSVTTVSLQIQLVLCMMGQLSERQRWQFWPELVRGHPNGRAEETSSTSPSSLLGNVSVEQMGIKVVCMWLKRIFFFFFFFILLHVRSAERLKTKKINFTIQQ